MLLLVFIAAVVTLAATLASVEAVSAVVITMVVAIEIKISVAFPYVNESFVRFRCETYGKIDK